MSGGHAELPVAARVRRLEERLIAAGLATDAELDEILERVFSSASPVNGARMAARAWKDPVTGTGSWLTAMRRRPNSASATGPGVTC